MKVRGHARQFREFPGTIASNCNNSLNQRNELNY